MRDARDPTSPSAHSTLCQENRRSGEIPFQEDVLRFNFFAGFMFYNWMLLSIYRLVLSGSNVVSGLRQRNGCFCYVTIFWFFRHMVHPPKNSGWLPGTGFANECKAEPLADNHLSSRGVVGFEPAQRGGGNAKQNHSLIFRTAAASTQRRSSGPG